MRKTRLHVWAAFMPAVLGGCCRSAHDREFVPFVSVVRRAAGELRDDLSVWGDPNFVAGLPLILMKYDCEFIWAPNIVRVRKRMMYHPPGCTADHVEFDEMDLRANLTDKAVGMGERFLAAKTKRQSP